MVRFSVHYAYKRLLNGYRPFQHALHYNVVASVYYFAYVNDVVAFGNDGVNFNGIVSQYAFARRFYPTSETSDTVGNFHRSQIEIRSIIAQRCKIKLFVAQNKFHF